MLPFLQSGNQCHLIDYNDNTLPGIVKIGNDITDTISHKKYDIIIISHVIEHVAEMRQLLFWLRKLLKDDGILYAEVPLEVFAGLKIEADPVTHINFFTRNSLLNLLYSCGFSDLESSADLSNYGKNIAENLWVVAKKSSESLTLVNSDANYMLYPSRRYSLQKITRLLSK
jgi:hypothetical protein